MSSSADEQTGADSDGNSRWPLVGVGGAVGLCCLFAAPGAGGAVGSTAGAGAMAAFGGGLVQILVSALTVGAIGVAVQLYAGRRSCKR